MPTRSAYLIGLVGLAGFACSVTAEHLLEPALNPLTHQVSEYVHTTSGIVMTVGFLSWAVSLGATAFCVRREWRSPLLTAFLVLAGFGLVLTAAFATQTVAGELPPGESLSLGGELHNLGSGLATIALLLAALASLRVCKAPPWFRRVTITVICMAILLTVALLGIGGEVGGLRQRLMILGGCLWQLALLRALLIQHALRSLSFRVRSGEGRSSLPR